MKKLSISTNMFVRKRLSKYLRREICGCSRQFLHPYFREEGEAAKSKKLLVNRSELVDLTRIMKTMQEEIRVTNNSFSNRLDHIEHHISRMRKKPKQNVCLKIDASKNVC